MRERVTLSWSGGKDSTMTLWVLRADPSYEVAVLLTTVTEGYDRISLHGVRRELLEAQAQALELPLEIATIPPDASDEVYRTRMEQVLRRLQAQGIVTVAFGDLFLEDVRRYREQWLRTIELKPIFPLWHTDTAQLSLAFVEHGFAAVVTCVDTRWLAPELAGRKFDASFLCDLPPQVDPCGERGEFHTFVYDGPLFRHAVPVRIGERVQRDGRTFCDLLHDVTKSQKERFP